MTEIPLATAARYAERIVAQLAAYCDRIEIAGSIRRARPTVNDVDIVCQPKAGQEGILRARCKARSEVLSEGSSSLLVRLKDGLQLDVWFAAPQTADLLTVTPSNWGSVLLCRTGSVTHNIWVCQRAHAKGLKWIHTQGLCRLSPGGDVVEIVASETEEAIYAALGLDWLAPVQRER